tara:strand:- start:652 stop:1449 length:798 start_codon:yes stop_codon:yes gene_type:complete
MKRLLYFILCLAVLNACGVKKEQTVELKIMSYNIRHGVGLDTVLDLSRAAAIIASQAPDICGLQEVDNFCFRSDSISQIDYLSQQTKMKGSFGKFMDYQGGAYGMATLSAKPLISTKILALPDAKYEPRSSIVHEVEVATNCHIVFANVHFDWIDEKEGSDIRLSQAKALVQYVNTLNKAVIITGDFNCTPESRTMQYFANQGFTFVQKGVDNLSFQGDSKAEIDHLLFRNSENVKFREKSVQLLIEPIASDHRPLIVALEVSYK